MTSPQFDQSIPSALEILQQEFGDADSETTLIRDPFGVLTVVLPDSTLCNWDVLAQRLHNTLGRFSPGERQVLLRQSDLIDPDDVIRSPDRIRIPNAPATWLVDRLQTNQDWIRAPLCTHPPLPTAVAFSIKGGVGRTSAFAVWAWHLARLGKDVLLIDLDLEAPGVASVLLDEAHIPDYGLIDWLIEAQNGAVDNALLRETLVDCALAQDTPGRLRVLPAFGRKSRDYIAKLGRIYLPAWSEGHQAYFGLAERLKLLLESIAGLAEAPQLVLLDARAGLHDIGSAAVTRLGAEVFLFARDDAQTWAAYRHLFRQLALSRGVSFGMQEDDLRHRLTMVGAQTDSTESAARRLVEHSFLAWTDELYDAEADPKGMESFEMMEDTAPHYPLRIGFDPRLRGLELNHSNTLPEWGIVKSAFGPFLNGATARLLPDGFA